MGVAETCLVRTHVPMHQFRTFNRDERIEKKNAKLSPSPENYAFVNCAASVPFEEIKIRSRAVAVTIFQKLFGFFGTFSLFRIREMRAFIAYENRGEKSQQTGGERIPPSHAARLV